MEYKKGIIILAIQLGIFYLLPFIAWNHGWLILDVFINLFLTLILSIILGIFFKNKIKHLYPFIVAILFIPSVFIFYNDSALIHSLWYFIVSIIGVEIGNLFNNKGGIK